MWAVIGTDNRASAYPDFLHQATHQDVVQIIFGELASLNTIKNLDSIKSRCSSTVEQADCCKRAIYELKVVNGIDKPIGVNHAVSV